MSSVVTVVSIISFVSVVTNKRVVSVSTSLLSVLEVELSTSDRTVVVVSVAKLDVDTIESVVKVVIDWTVVAVVGGVSDFSAICVVELRVTSSPTPDTRVLLSTSSVEVSVTSTVCVVVSGPELVSSVILDIKMSNSGSVSNATDSVVI